MSYTVRLEQTAERELKGLPGNVLRRIDARLRGLSENPRPPGVAKLSGRQGGGWRIRVGGYRLRAMSGLPMTR